MASRGNQTCVQLHDVATTGLAHHSNSFIVKGTWYPQHFSLAITDGVSAWNVDATEAFVIQRASDLKVTAAQFVDNAHLHLGHGHKSSLYSLHAKGSNCVQLLCTPRDGRDLNMDSTINLPLKAASVLDLTFEMVMFLMHAYQDVVEKSERKSRTYERTKATIEQSVEGLQCEKKQLQYEKTQLEMQVLSIKDSGLKLREIELAIVPIPSSSTLKRRLDSSIEDSALQKKCSWKGRPLWKPLSPPEPDALGSNRESSRLRTSAVPPATAKEVGPNLTEFERPSPSEEELSGCDGEWNAGERSNVKMPTAFNNDETPHTMSKCLRLQPGKKRGRKPKVSVVQAQDIEAPLPLVRTFGGPQRDSLTREILSEHRIEEQSERAIKLLEPYTRHLANPRTRTIGKTPLAPKVAGKAVGRKRETINEERTLHLRQPSEDTSTQSSVALPLVLSRERITDTTPGLTKEFNVINADFYDFDNERSKYVMGLGQYWALYDNQDGMPRFYGRIVNLVLEPFEIDVEWLEPYRPTLGFSGLVESTGLSVACGEFKRDTISAQTLAAFSHRVEVEADAKKKMYRIFPRKGEVWALYKDWDKPLLKEFSENDVPKFEYELVEVLSEYSKERGVKVGHITKVLGFKTVFRSGGSMAPHWIPGKDLQALFSHQIALHRFDGSETRVVPRGSFGLDSASMPEQFLSSTSGRVINTPLVVEVMQTISESG